jgi:hypothetical protein
VGGQDQGNRPGLLHGQSRTASKPGSEPQFWANLWDRVVEELAKLHGVLAVTCDEKTSRTPPKPPGPRHSLDWTPRIASCAAVPDDFRHDDTTYARVRRHGHASAFHNHTLHHVPKRILSHQRQRHHTAQARHRCQVQAPGFCSRPSSPSRGLASRGYGPERPHRTRRPALPSFFIVAGGLAASGNLIGAQNLDQLMSSPRTEGSISHSRGPTRYWVLYPFTVFSTSMTKILYPREWSENSVFDFGASAFSLRLRDGFH